VSEVGGWSGGVFNGGAWLEIDGRRADAHYRDLDAIDRELTEARAGRFRIEALMFHLERHQSVDHVNPSADTLSAGWTAVPASVCSGVR
jgi:hypothetical protein